MAKALTADQVAVTADGVPLRTKLRRAERLVRLRAYGLILPLFAFILITFFVPIVVMLARSVENPLLADNFPNTLALLKGWDPATQPLPPEPVFAALAAELAAAYDARTIGQVATRVNFEQGGTRSLFTKTGRHVAAMKGEPKVAGSWQQTLIGIDKDWGQPEVWATLKNYGSPYTLGYFLDALDLHLWQ